MRETCTNIEKLSLSDNESNKFNAVISLGDDATDRNGLTDVSMADVDSKPSPQLCQDDNILIDLLTMDRVTIDDRLAVMKQALVKRKLSNASDALKKLPELLSFVRSALTEMSKVLTGVSNTSAFVKTI